MASLVDDPNGRRRILFVGLNAKRKTVRLGKIDRKSAESICRHVEIAFLAAKIGGQITVPRDTAGWLAAIGDTLRAKLAAVGLVEARVPADVVTVGGQMTEYKAARSDVKPGTAVNLDQAGKAAGRVASRRRGRPSAT